MCVCGNSPEAFSVAFRSFLSLVLLSSAVPFSICHLAFSSSHRQQPVNRRFHHSNVQYNA